jgi:outer membrane protein assembly factor BamB
MARIGRVALFLVIVGGAVVGKAENWPGWRGPRGDGTSLERDVPTTWNGQTGEHVKWRCPLPGRGHSSPVVWEDRIFLTSCVEEKSQRLLMCVDRNSGKLMWQRMVFESPLEKKHLLNSFASGTPVTDGKYVYAAFLDARESSQQRVTPGDMVVVAYDLTGNPQWTARPGPFASVHGFCTSPILFEQLVIVNGDHDGDSYIVALDRNTGEAVWKVPRRHKTRSYVTPIIRKIGDRTQMVLSGSMHVASYDPRDGSQHWTIDGPTEQFVASLVYDGKLLFLTAGYPEHHILAIRPDGSGDVTQSHIVWRTTRGASYVPSPIVEGAYFLVTADNGIVTCFDAPTGRVWWRERLGPHYSASMVSANGLVYLLDDDGLTKVVRPGRELQVVSENPLGEPCRASPAISQGQIFLRGDQHLYCIEAE